MKAGWLSSLGLALGAWTGAAGAADDVVWRAAAPQPAAERRPAPVTIGHPVPIAPSRPAPPASVAPVSWSGAGPDRRVVVRAQSGLPPPEPPPGVGGSAPTYPSTPYVPPSGPP